MRTAPTPIITAVLGFCTAALLSPAAAPALAESFRPNVAGPLFCNLYRQGVHRDMALRHSIAVAWDQRRTASQRQDDVAAMVDYVRANCAGAL